ncbi:hypothetical protein SERLADRAFT_475407 [Serpula lacrymans var. lacrymans S7.9]|uniref:Uncharacterized protein n=1 Tax=Serpula lacrymans var. lacrymans (strain S7.9) TaxID=578457 RepID=F8P680_SERL9|nr:uncharacterized protein SERLADRAFT_475407 [Serpula lacrymans var. lacrymans S7.9]EGO20947.1 hypothetical protein SERLADRAFT_475407 [Serpula lacrymans var. lacrymans S7.9]
MMRRAWAAVRCLVQMSFVHRLDSRPAPIAVGLLGEKVREGEGVLVLAIPGES